MAPPTPRLSVCHDRWTRRLGFTHYDAYIIASTGHAASYVSPTGTLLTGQEKTSLSQRGGRAWKHIGEKIHNYCSHLKYSAQYATQSCWAHLSGPQRPMYPHPLIYKRGAPARRKLRPGKGQGRAEDRVIHNQEQYFSQWM